MYLNKNSVCLITSGTGLVGRNLANGLKKRRLKKIILTNSKMYDLTKMNECYKMFNKFKPTIVYNFAAKVGGILDNKKFPADYYFHNTMISTNIFECSKIFKIKKLINVGAGCGYPLNIKEPLKEEQIFNGLPQEESLPYSMSKKMIFVASQAYKKQYDLNSISVIPSNIYGKFDNFNLDASHVIPALLRKFHEAVRYNKKKVEIWGNGSAMRDFIYAEDFTNSLIELTNKYNSTKPLNICTGKQYSIKSISNSLKKISGFKGKIFWNTKMPSGAKSRKFSTVNLQKYLGNNFKKFKNVDDGLKVSYQWLKDNYNNKLTRL